MSEYRRSHTWSASRMRDLLTVAGSVTTGSSDLYFIQVDIEDGPIKIGIANDVAKRMAGLQTAHPWRLKLLASYRDEAGKERALHALLAEHRMSGEWFHPAPDVLTAVDGNVPTSMLSMPCAYVPGKTWADLEYYDFIDMVDARWRGSQTSSEWGRAQYNLRHWLKRFNNLREAFMYEWVEETAA